MERIILIACIAVYSVECTATIPCSPETSEFIGSPIYGDHDKRIFKDLGRFYSVFRPAFVKREQRSTEPFFPENPLPWSCVAETIWRDLGEDHYPRFVRDVHCTQSRCWYGHYGCAPASTNIKVLRRNNGECFDDTLPVALRTSWKFVNVLVTAGCICTR